MQLDINHVPYGRACRTRTRHIILPVGLPSSSVLGPMLRKETTRKYSPGWARGWAQPVRYIGIPVTWHQEPSSRMIPGGYTRRIYLEDIPGGYIRPPPGAGPRSRAQTLGVVGWGWIYPPGISFGHILPVYSPGISSGY
jgi:hypothetical protein